MTEIKRLAALLLTFCLLAGGAVAEDEEISLGDTGIVWEEVTYDDVTWNFPVDLSDMEPDLVVLANKHMLLSKDFIPADLVKIPTRKTNSDGSNKNGGVRKASSGEM